MEGWQTTFAVAFGNLLFFGYAAVCLLVEHFKDIKENPKQAMLYAFNSIRSIAVIHYFIPPVERVRLIAPVCADKSHQNQLGFWKVCAPQTCAVADNGYHDGTLVCSVYRYFRCGTVDLFPTIVDAHAVAG
jgi:hypothetical protein